MELQVSKPAKAKPSPDNLVRAVKRCDAILARMVADETYLDGAIAYTSPARDAVALANAATDVRLPPGIAAEHVLTSIESHFHAAGVSCRSLDCSEQQWPAELTTAIERRGYRAVPRLVLLLAEYASPTADPAIQVIPGRAAYSELRTLALTRASRMFEGAKTSQQIADAWIDQLDDSRIDVFLARAQRKPVGAASLLTLGNIGVVLEVFADAGSQDDSTLATLAVRLFDHCLRAQFEQVIVRLDEGDAQTTWYTKLGFRPAASYVSYVR